MPITGIAHVQIAAPERCEGDARRFFSDLLGLEEIEKPEALRARGGCWFRAGQHQLHVGVEKHFQPAKKAHPAFSVDRVHDLFATLTNAGVPCQGDEPLGGYRRFYAEDPWGNRLEFTEADVRATDKEQS